MASEKHLRLLKQGDVVWNQWRHTHPEIVPDLAGAPLHRAWLRRYNLSRANLSQADLSEANLSEADFTQATLTEANLTHTSLTHANLRGATLHKASPWGANLNRARLSGATLTEANLRGATLRGANLRGATFTRCNLRGVDCTQANLRGAILTRVDLSGATLRGANLSGATLHRADLWSADLTGADLSRASFIDAQLHNTRLSGCRVYGISLWGVQLEGADQRNLSITPKDHFTITVDHLTLAQFLHLLLSHADLREIISPLSSKVVFILGGFSSVRQVVLEAMREELRKHDYVPVWVDCEHPDSREMTETVRTLAQLARFIIADLTEPNSIPQELVTLIPEWKVPVQPLLHTDALHGDLLFRNQQHSPWVLPTARFQDSQSLLAAFREQAIEPAERKAREAR